MTFCSRRTLAVVVSAVFLLIFVPSCAREQQLTSIQVQPSGATFGAIEPTLVVNFKAIGTYIHPPQTKDITSTVNWQSNTPQVAQVNSSGAVSPNLTCGTAGIFAIMHDHASGSDVVSNTAQIVVNGPASLGCTPSGAQAVLSVQFSGSGSGSVSSTPAGLTCSSPNSCTASFTVGTTVVLTANPVGTSTFGGWTGCNTQAGPTCTINLQNSVTVTATFNP